MSKVEVSSLSLYSPALWPRPIWPVTAGNKEEAGKCKAQRRGHSPSRPVDRREKSALSCGDRPKGARSLFPHSSKWLLACRWERLINSDSDAFPREVRCLGQNAQIGRRCSLYREYKKKVRPETIATLPRICSWVLGSMYNAAPAGLEEMSDVTGHEC